MIEGKSLGEIAFDAYVLAKSGTTYDGKPIPIWSELPQDVRSAWEKAAIAVTPSMQLNEREWQLIYHARTYARDYSQAGIPGHNMFMLLAKLTSAFLFRETDEQ